MLKIKYYFFSRSIFSPILNEHRSFSVFSFFFLFEPNARWIWMYFAFLFSYFYFQFPFHRLASKANSNLECLNWISRVYVINHLM